MALRPGSESTVIVNRLYLKYTYGDRESATITAEADDDQNC